MRQISDELEEKRLWFDLDNPLDHMIFESNDYNSIYRELRDLILKNSKH